MAALPEHNLPPLQDIAFAYSDFIPQLLEQTIAQDTGIVVLSAPDGSGKTTIALATAYQLGGDLNGLSPDAMPAPTYATIVWVLNPTPEEDPEGLSREALVARQLYRALSAVLGVQIGSSTQCALALEDLVSRRADATRCPIAGALFVFDRLLDDLPDPAPAATSQSQPLAEIWEHVATIARDHRVLIISRDEAAMRERITSLGVPATYLSLPPFSQRELNRLLKQYAEEECSNLGAETLGAIETTARMLHAAGHLNLYLLRELYGNAHCPSPVVVDSVMADTIDNDAADPLVKRAVALVRERIRQLGQTSFSRSRLVLLAFTYFDRDLGPTVEMLQDVLFPLLQDERPRQAIMDELTMLCRLRLIVRTRTFSRGEQTPQERFALLPATYDEVSNLARRVWSSHTGALQRTMDNLLDGVWKWYLRFTDEEHNGGLDWGDDWVARYGRLREEWPNLLAVLDHCLAQGRFDHIRDLWDWKHLQQFANISGYWPERLKWLGYIIDHERAKLPTADPHAIPQIQRTLGEACAAKAFTLAHNGTLDQAESILQDVAVLEETSHFARCEAEASLALLCIRQGWRDHDPVKYAKANDHLKTLEQHTSDLGDSLRMKRRWEIEVPYYRGVTAYVQGQWEEAQACFEAMLEKEKDLFAECGCHYVRAELYAVSYLADIALRKCAGKSGDEKQDLLDQAGAYLRRIRTQMSVPGHFDARRHACILSTNAFYLHEHGQDLKAKQVARQALWRFTVLGMRREREEVEGLLAKLP